MRTRDRCWTTLTKRAGSDASRNRRPDALSHLSRGPLHRPQRRGEGRTGGIHSTACASMCTVCHKKHTVIPFRRVPPPPLPVPAEVVPSSLSLSCWEKEKRAGGGGRERRKPAARGRASVKGLTVLEWNIKEINTEWTFYTRQPARFINRAVARASARKISAEKRDYVPA